MADLAESIEPTSIDVTGYHATGSPSVEQCVIANPEHPGGWGWSVTSYHPDGNDHGYLASARGLAAFCTGLSAEFPDGADEDIGPIHSNPHPQGDYLTAFHEVALRMLAMLAHASRVALGTYPPAVETIGAQERRFEERFKRDASRELERLRQHFDRDSLHHKLEPITDDDTSW